MNNKRYNFYLSRFTAIKASALSFKRFTSRLLKVSFSLYAPITSVECHDWFHLNAASPAVRNTEQVNITKKNLIHGRIWTTNTAPLDFQCVSLTTRQVDGMRLELSHYLFTLRYYKNSVCCAKGNKENKNKIVAYLPFGDWYHLNTSWLTQKKKFMMSYVSMTICNIYSFCLLLSILPILVSLYCIFVLDKKSREINRKNGWFMYNLFVAALPIWRNTKKTVFSLTKIRDNTTKIYFISTDNVFLPS